MTRVPGCSAKINILTQVLSFALLVCLLNDDSDIHLRICTTVLQEFHEGVTDNCKQSEIGHQPN